MTTATTSGTISQKTGFPTERLMCTARPKQSPFQPPFLVANNSDTGIPFHTGSNTLRFPLLFGDTATMMMSGVGNKNPVSASNPGGGTPPPDAKELLRLTQLTKTPAGEVTILNRAISGEADGVMWLGAVRSGLTDDGHPLAKQLAGRPLAKQLVSMTSMPLIPELTPALTPELRTPWGGTLLTKMLSDLGVKVPHKKGGELWAISGHKSFPNILVVPYAGQSLNVPITVLANIAPDRLLGEVDRAEHGEEFPFLFKLLNSGSYRSYKQQLQVLATTIERAVTENKLSAEHSLTRLTAILGKNNHELLQGLNSIIADLKLHPAPQSPHTLSTLHELRRLMLASNLSVQIHPPATYNSSMPSKTESWVILDAEKGAGIYLGLKEDVTKEEMKAKLRAGDDITPLLNFVEVLPGEVYHIPAGTPHAIGAGLILGEIQETSETTFRYYDYGRTVGGQPRQLHIKDALAVTNWDAPRGEAFVKLSRRTPLLMEPKKTGSAVSTVLVQEPEFTLNQITFVPRDQHKENSNSRLQGLTVVEGEVSIVLPDGKVFADIKTGQSAVIPASLGEYQLISANHSTVLQTKGPILTPLIRRRNGKNP